jgi:oligopeptide transport system ATP-binding protein
MLDLGKQYGLTMLFVSHDLAVVRHIADRIIVLYHGKIVETGTSESLFNAPQEAYTKSLLASIPGRNRLAS